MALNFGRTGGTATIRIDEQVCTNCGLCVKVCKGAPLHMEDGHVRVDQNRYFAFRDDLLNAMRSVKWVFSPFVLGLLRPFIGKEACELYSSFIVPAVDAYVEKEQAGIDWFFYDAPLSLYFCGSPYADPADPFIVATYAMLSGEALGLGSCMLGFPGQILQYHRKLRAKYGLPTKTQMGLAVIFGYPAVRFQHAIKRRFAQTEYR